MNENERRLLEDLLDREIVVARRLAATLEAERAALTGPDADAVSREAADKIHLLTTLEKLEEERRALAAAAQQELPGSPVARGAGSAPSVADRWRTLMELIGGCRVANEVNGYIIRTRQGQVRELLAAVRGSAPSATYTAQGKTFTRALRALARA
jgi:flagellar biosynthesis/type III secretory pathway chaperone